MNIRHFCVAGSPLLRTQKLYDLGCKTFQPCNEKLPSHRRELIKGKRALLLREMRRDARVPDDGLVDLQLLGTPLSGVSGTTLLFSCRVSLLQKCGVSHKRKLQKDGYRDHSLSSNFVKNSAHYMLSRHGWIRQTDKVRPIDDLSISLVNSSFSASYALELDGVDGIAVELSEGSKLQGRLHHSLSLSDAKKILGRTLDLDSAYKQLLVRQSSLWASVLQVRDPHGAPHFYVSQVLPFGASAAVYSFNRFSKALRMIGSRLFSLVWSCYFDDFTQFDLQSSRDSAQRTAEGFLNLVGWHYSLKETKRQPMAEVLSVLGVEFGLSVCRSGRVVIRNKPSRIEQISHELHTARSFSTASATSSRGRLQLAESQTFGRAINLFMKSCNARAAGSLPGSFVDEAVTRPFVPSLSGQKSLSLAMTLGFLNLIRAEKSF